MFGRQLAALPEAAALSSQVVHLRLEGDRVVLKARRLAHAVLVFDLVALNLFLKVSQARLGLLQVAVARRNLTPGRLVFIFGGEQLRRGLLSRGGERPDVQTHRGELAALLRQVVLQVAGERPFVAQRRFAGRDMLPGGGQLGFLLPERGVKPGHGFLDAAQFPRARVCGFEVYAQRRFQHLQGRAPVAQVFVEDVILAEPQTDAQLAQPGAVFLIALRLGGLQFHRAELLLDFVEDVAQALQVLVDALQFPQRLDLAGLEAADAGGFFENSAPLLGRGLQQHVDAALLDDAVGVVPGAAAEEEVLDVLEAADLAVDEVFALAGAVDAARDLDFVGLGGEFVAAVVEGHGYFGQAEAAPRRRAVENDVGHLAAAQAFGALLAEDPLDRVD